MEEIVIRIFQQYIINLQIFQIIWGVIFLLVFFITNAVLNTVIEGLRTFLNFKNPSSPEIKISLLYTFNLNGLVYFALLILSMSCSSVMIYKLKSKFGSLEDGQNGISKFTNRIKK